MGNPFEDLRQAVVVRPMNSPGPQGAAAPHMKIKYSADGVTWHNDPVETDKYLSFSTDNGTTWSDAIYFNNLSETLEWVEKARQWAENPENVEVEPGKYSALHHATKAARSETNAEAAALDAAGSAAKAFGAAAPAWDSTTTYSYNDVVSFDNGHTYRCIGSNVTTPPNTDGVDDEINWTRITVGPDGFFEYDTNYDLQPVIAPVAKTGPWMLDELGDIQPRLDPDLAVSELDELISESVNIKHVDSVAELRSSTFSAKDEYLYLDGYYGKGTPGGGILYRDSTDTSTADNGGTVFVDSDGVRWKRDVYEYNVFDFGAKPARLDSNFDNADVFDNILNLINLPLGEYPPITTIVFPSEIFRTSRTLKIHRGHVVLKGLGTGRGYFGIGTASGAHIEYIANDGGPIIDMVPYPDDAFNYGLRIERISVAGYYVDVKPIGFRIQSASEVSLAHVAAKKCSVGFDFKGVGIVSVKDFYSSNNEIGIRMTGAFRFPLLSTGCSIMWFENGNVWQSSQAAIQITNVRTSRGVTFSECWFERALHMVEILGWEDHLTIGALTFNNCSFVSNNYFGSTDRNGWFIKMEASQIYTSKQTHVKDLLINNCHIKAESDFGTLTGAAINYLRGSNTSPSSFFQNGHIKDSWFDGENIVISADTRCQCEFDKVTYSNILANEKIETNGWTFLGDIQGRDYSMSNPWLLPQRAFSYETTGQFGFDKNINRTYFTAHGKQCFSKKQGVTLLSDADTTVSVKNSFDTVVCKVPLTTNRIITLSTDGAFEGATFRVIRTLASSGSDLTVAGKTLLPGEWCDVVFVDGSWIVGGYGNL